MPRIIRADYYEYGGPIVSEASEVIGRCGLVVVGTDTLYGLLADPFHSECVEKVYGVKRRGREKPLPLLAYDLGVVEEAAIMTTCARRMASILWPGPVTIVLPVEKHLFPPPLVADGKVGFRVPASPLPRLIAGETGGFITGTSANISGEKPPRTMMEAYGMLGSSVDLYIDTGLSPIGMPSTVIEILDRSPRLIREGAISFNTILSIWNLMCGRDAGH